MGRYDRHVLTLYDADRCPYVGRVRIVLAEKSIPYESVAIDLDDRPAWLYEKNPAGRVPVVEDVRFPAFIRVGSRTELERAVVVDGLRGRRRSEEYSRDHHEREERREEPRPALPRSYVAFRFN